MAVSALNVALPTIQRDLGASGTELQWIVDAYALVFAGLLLPAGALGDRFGRKGALEIGLVIFGIAAFAASQATDPGQLIALRTVMGVGAAFIMPATLSIILNSFPIQERPKAIAIWAAFAGVGGALGPITSGLLLEHFWWGSVFMVTLPIVAALLLLTALFVPTSPRPGSHCTRPDREPSLRGGSRRSGVRGDRRAQSSDGRRLRRSRGSSRSSSGASRGRATSSRSRTRCSTRACSETGRSRREPRRSPRSSSARSGCSS